MGFFDALLKYTTELDLILWGPAMIALLLGTGVFLTFRTRGIQFTHFWSSLKLVFSKESRSEEGRGDISPFAALMTALAATVGNGNIAGVATAIAIGGPGAPVFMWIAGLFGMATNVKTGLIKAIIIKTKTKVVIVFTVYIRPGPNTDRTEFRSFVNRAIISPVLFF